MQLYFVVCFDLRQSKAALPDKAEVPGDSQLSPLTCAPWIIALWSEALSLRDTSVGNLRQGSLPPIRKVSKEAFSFISHA